MIPCLLVPRHTKGFLIGWLIVSHPQPRRLGASYLHLQAQRICGSSYRILRRHMPALHGRLFTCLHSPRSLRMTLTTPYLSLGSPHPSQQRAQRWNANPHPILFQCPLTGSSPSARTSSSMEFIFVILGWSYALQLPLLFIHHNLHCMPPGLSPGVVHRLRHRQGVQYVRHPVVISPTPAPPCSGGKSSDSASERGGVGGASSEGDFPNKISLRFEAQRDSI